MNCNDQILNLRLSVVGLGKLGSPMAAVLAAKGFVVTGIDLNHSVVNDISKTRAPFEEPKLQEYLNLAGSRLRATTDFNDGIKNTDITFVIVPTPSGPDNKFSNAFLLDALEKISTAIRHKESYHLIVITSTVMPGATHNCLKPCIERFSGQSIGSKIGLCYSPEFIALGSVIDDMLHPDMVLIGEYDDRAGNLLEKIYRAIVENNPEICRMNLINAEITKIAVNTYVTTKISYANMIGGLCDRLQDADAAIVTAAIGSDSRIGRKYLKPALGYGGPCFPRDNKAFTALAREVGANCSLAEATDEINDLQTLRLVELVVSNTTPLSTICILGLSYKPFTSVIEESQGLALAMELYRKGYRVIVSDPQALPAVRQHLPNEVGQISELAQAIRDSDLIVVATPWPQYAQLPVNDLLHGGKRRIIIDPWRHTVSAEIQAPADVISLGAAGLALDRNVK